MQTHRPVAATVGDSGMEHVRSHPWLLEITARLESGSPIGSALLKEAPAVLLDGFGVVQARGNPAGAKPTLQVPYRCNVIVTCGERAP